MNFDHNLQTQCQARTVEEGGAAGIRGIAGSLVSGARLARANVERLRP